MFPISSLTSADVQPVKRAAQTSAVSDSGINAVDTATDAAPAASVAVDLSPVAGFILAVSNAQQQLGPAPGSSAQRADTVNAAVQQLAPLGVMLQPPLLSDLTGGLALEPQQLRAAVNANNEQATATLQHTLATFRQLATDFAERLSANPALAAAVAAYNINGLAGVYAAPARAAAKAIPAVDAVYAASAIRATGKQP